MLDSHRVRRHGRPLLLLFWKGGGGGSKVMAGIVGTIEHHFWGQEAGGRWGGGSTVMVEMKNRRGMFAFRQAHTQCLSMSQQCVDRILCSGDAHQRTRLLAEQACAGQRGEILSHSPCWRRSSRMYKLSVAAFTAKDVRRQRFNSWTDSKFL